MNGAQSNYINFNMVKHRVITLGKNNHRTLLPSSVEQTDVLHNLQLEAERQIPIRNKVQISTASLKEIGQQPATGGGGFSIARTSQITAGLFALRHRVYPQ